MNANTFLAIVMAIPVFVVAQSLPTDYSAESATQLNPAVPSPSRDLESAPYDQSLEFGPHHRQYLKVLSVTNEEGTVVLQTNRFISLESGMNYQRLGVWLKTKEIITPAEDGGAMASQGLTQVKFAADISTDGAIEITTPDHKKIRNHLLGLMYFDSHSGQSAVIATVQRSVGEILPPNQVIYRDVFKEVKADAIFTYQRSGLEADIILLEGLNPPGDYGLNEEDCKLQAVTAFLDDPTPAKTVRILKSENRPEKRNAMVEPDFIDETLDFGQVQMIMGRCFSLKERSSEPFFARSESDAPIAKRFQKINGLDYLIESVEYGRVKAKLEKLPRTASRINRRPSQNFEIAVKGLRETRVARAPSGVMKMALNHSPAQDGLVLDYILVNSVNNFTFESGKTYLVTGLFTLGGTTTIQGGSFIKYRPDAPNKQGGAIIINGPLNCLTSSGSQAYFTACDDNIPLSDTIAGSTGNPAGYYGYTYLCIYSDVATTDLHHLVMRYGARAILYQGEYPYFQQSFHHNRLENCNYGIYSSGALVTASAVNMCSVAYSTYTQSGPPINISGTTFDCTGVQIATPTITPNGGSISQSIEVTLHTITGAPIYYTLDGTVPTTSSTRYLSRIMVPPNSVVCAKAFNTGMIDSGVAVASFSEAQQVAAPVISPNGGIYSGAILVSMSSATPGAVVRYTLDGTTPTTSSQICSGNFVLYDSATLKARAFKTGLAPSTVSTAGFTMSTPSSLGEALDNTSYNWTTTEEEGWYGQSAISYYGNDAVQNMYIPDDADAAFESYVTGPGTICFYWKVSSEAGYDPLTFYYGGFEIEKISGEVEWKPFIHAIGPGTHYLMWVYRKDYGESGGADTSWVDYFQFIPSGIGNPTLAQAVDNSSLNWTTGGAGNWTGQFIPTSCEGDAAQSAPNGYNQTTYLQTQVNEPGDYSFVWKISATGYDTLTFSIDSIAQNIITDEVDWTTVNFSLSSGSHTLRWEFANHFPYDTGAAGWVDRFQKADNDNDGMRDTWELQHFGHLNQNGSTDYDGDGVLDADEYQFATNPTIGNNLEIITPLRD